MNQVGILGIGVDDDVKYPTPQTVIGLPHPDDDPAIDIAAGGSVTCSVHDSGRVFCWGMRLFWEPADGVDFAHTPIEVAGADAVQISIGDVDVCAVSSQGTVSCWGDNNNGVLGPASCVNICQPSDTPVEIPLTDVEHVEVGTGTACALTQSGVVKCWGHYPTGLTPQIQNGGWWANPTPVLVPDLDDGIDIGMSTLGTVCAARGPDGAVCWGTGNHGQLGNGQLANSINAPVDVADLP